MWIKICANTNLEDARLAAELGAHAVGFVFARSSRRVTPEQAGAIAALLPAGVERIGVFDTHDTEDIVRTVQHARLNGVQLHGELDLGLVRRLSAVLGDSVPLTQAVHWNTTPGAPAPADSLRKQLRRVASEPAIQRVLIDSRVGGATGGTGVSFDWKTARDILRDELGSIRLIVAGGLTPENVGEAIKTLDPWGVDVASGVEASPGKKDPERLEAFLRKASSNAAGGKITR